VRLKAAARGRMETRYQKREGVGERGGDADLVRKALRMRPDHSSSSDDARGPEAPGHAAGLCMNTGHGASLTTIHSNDSATTWAGSRFNGRHGRFRHALGDPPADHFRIHPHRPVSRLRAEPK